MRSFSVFWSVGLLSILSSAGLAAQGRAMLRHPTEKDSLAAAFERRDSTTLRATPEQFLLSIQGAIPEASLKDISELPAYIRGLEARSCPDGIYHLSRVVMPTSTVDFKYQRAFRKGEECLFDNNAGKYVLSLWCGNVIQPNEAGVHIPLRAEAAPPRVAEPASAPPTPQNTFPQPAVKSGKHGVGYYILRAGILAGVAFGAYEIGKSGSHNGSHNGPVDPPN